MTETQTSSWWAGSSWFQAGGPGATGLQEAAALPTAHGPAQEHNLKEGEQGPGGAVAQSRFMGRTHIPVFRSAPVDGAPVISHTTPSPQQAGNSGGQRLSGPGACARYGWSGPALTCDGSGAAQEGGRGSKGGAAFVSRWEFDVDSWQWRHKGAGAEAEGPPQRRAEHDIAARRWGDGRDTLGAARAAHMAPAQPEQQGAAKRQRVVVTAVRGGEGEAAGWASLGGLARQKELLSRAVLMPLRHPALFKRLGVDAVRGVLLHGPTGSGKTALARALAGEAGERVHFEVLNGAECVGGDDAAGRMRRAFHTARSKAPSILFIDELDAVAPSREGSTPVSQSERQATGHLLALVDELRRSKAQVALVAATNRRSALEGCLRRAGRLDLEVSLGQLTQEDRVEVLRCATRAMPLGPCIDLPALAARLRGYAAADCVAACTEAALRCACEAVAAAEEADGGDLGRAGSQELLDGLRVEARHFEAALRTLRPAALRGLCPELPEVRWDDVGGLQEAKAALRELVEFPLRHGALMQSMGMPAPRGALMYGPPGCGKTLLAKAAAAGCGAHFVSVRGPELLNMWLGESERAVRTLFETARTAAPCIIFFDELDSIAARRGGAGGAGDAAGARVLNQLLLEMDGISDRGGVFVLAATNRPEALDPAIMRPGRFDHLVKVSLPDEPSRLEVLRAALRCAPLHPGVDLPALAAATEGCSGADLAELCRRAGMAAVREWVAAEQAQQGCAEAEVVLTQAHLDAALGTLRRSVSAEVAGRYDDLEARLREGSLEAPDREPQGQGREGEGEEGEAATGEGKEGGGAMAGAGEAGPSSGGGSDDGSPGRAPTQGELMRSLVRATLDHSYASKAQELQARVEQLEAALREAGLQVPAPAGRT